MLNMSRRDVVIGAGLAAALGLNSRLAIVGPASAQPAPEAGKGVYKYKVGSVEVTALYDGIWKKPHDPAFIKNASVDDTKAALAKAGMTTDYMPIPLTVIVLKVGDKLIMVDSGSGVGQWQPTAVGSPRQHEGSRHRSGQDQHHPDLAFPSRPHLRLDGEGHQRAHLPERRACGERDRIQMVDRAGPGREAARRHANRSAPVFKMCFRPGRTSSSWREKGGCTGHPPCQCAGPHARPLGLPRGLGNQQLMISNDTAYVPALLAPHPEWQGAYDQDGPLAVETRRKLIDRVIADKIAICGAHFPFPGAGTFVKDGTGYAFTPVKA